MTLDVKGQALDLAVIGNCRTAALVDAGGRIVWWCFPRFDSDPAFSRLLAGSDEKGFCDVTLDGHTTTEAAYQRNTAIVETIIRDDSGNAVRITDFTPRFKRFERIFNPPQLFRRIEPIAGLPRIRIRVRPTFNYGQPCVSKAMGSNHIRYAGGVETLRLTTDAPLSYIAQESSFALIKPVTLILGPDEPFEAERRVDLARASGAHAGLLDRLGPVACRAVGIPVRHHSRRHHASSCAASRRRAPSSPPIRRPFPEAPGTSRNWDYRFCWLRDAFFVIKALNRLGATQTMENYIHYITNVAVHAERPLRPVYGIVRDRTARRVACNRSGGLPGHGSRARGQPGRRADCSTMPTAASFSARRRCSSTSGCPAWAMLRYSTASSRLAVQARRFAFEPDAGPWEYRGRQRVHTHSATMCWVACDRLASIAQRLGLASRAAHWREQADALRNEILARAWNERRGVITGALDHDDLDASVLLLSELGILHPNDERFSADVRRHRQGAQSQRFHHALYVGG